MPTPHPPDPAFAALQLSDSFFPSGMYATSSGLEAIFYEGGRSKLEALRGRLPALLETYISNQLGPVDCVLLSNAYDFALKSDLPGLLDLDRMAHCLRPVKEIREASARSGSQLLRCVSAFGNGGFLDDLNFKRTYGPSTFDQTHMLTINHVYELPFGKGQALLNKGGVLAAVLSHWQVSGVLR